MKGYSRVKCPVCGEVLEVLTHTHAGKHGYPNKEALIADKGQPEEVQSNFGIIGGEKDRWLTKTTKELNIKSFLW